MRDLLAVRADPIRSASDVRVVTFARDVNFTKASFESFPAAAAAAAAVVPECPRKAVRPIQTFGCVEPNLVNKFRDTMAGHKCALRAVRRTEGRALTFR